MASLRSRLVPPAVWLLASTIVLLAVVGAVRNYSIVPHWDMWHGYLHFHTLFSEGDWGTLFAFHNEHRIVLARLLFWIDLEWLRGTIWFLLVVNYLLVLAAFLTFRAFALGHPVARQQPRAVRLLLWFVLALLFAWVQWENLTWGFQSQFFLAQWLPLLALYLLSRAQAAGPHSQRQFVLACVVGVLALGSMASGLLALPLMLVYALWERMGWRRVAVLALLTAVLLPLYWVGFVTPPSHGDIAGVTKLQPRRLLQYAMAYLGSPFWHLLGERSIALTQAFGFAFLALATDRAVRVLRQPSRDAWSTALLVYIAYIVGTALATGIGRLVFGLHQATASRYTTPALMAWVALLLLYLPALAGALAAFRHRVVWPMLAVLGVVLAYQIRAAEPQYGRLFEREVAGLAVQMQVMDEEQIRPVYFNMLWAQAIHNRQPDRQLSIFGVPAVRDAYQVIGKPVGPLPAARCNAVYVDLRSVDKEPKYLRVMGWIAPPPGANAITAVRIANDDGVVVGYALAAEHVEQAPPEPGGAPARLFKGYLQPRFAHVPLTLVANGTPCAIRMPPILAEALPVVPEPPSK